MKQLLSKIRYAYMAMMVGLLSLPSFAFAKGALVKSLDQTATRAFGSSITQNADPAVFIGKVIDSVFSFLGVAFLVLMLWGGLRWMTAGGDSGAVKKAQDIMGSAIVGLIVIFLSYSATVFFIEVVFKLTIGGGTP